MEENPTRYKVDISFTYVDEVNPENESPGSCDINEELFKRFFQLVLKENSELVSFEKKGTYFQCVFSTRIKYMTFMMSLQNFRFKVRGKLAKVADISIIVV